MLNLRWRDWLKSFHGERRMLPRRNRFLPRLEVLEDRWAPATFTVLNTADSGADSLRQAILAANTAPNVGGVPDRIQFNIGAGGLQTISPLSGLPTITDAVIIDGTTQPGFAGTPLIELDGTKAGASNGLFITAGNSTVRGLVINRFSFSGIVLDGGDNSLIAGNFLGTDASGTSDQGNGIHGLRIQNGSNGNTVGGTTAADRNVISGNGNGGFGLAPDGIEIFDSANNLVVGNFLGTDVTGKVAIGNQFAGVQLAGNDNTVGGTGAGAGNVISGNGGAGVFIASATDAQRNVVVGNLIGTDVTGTKALGNLDGVLFTDNKTFTSHDNTIGGTTAAERNIISGNTSDGIQFGFAGGSNAGPRNVVAGNFIGLDINGNPLGNGAAGVHIFQGSSGQIIGGTAAGASNVISANGTNGISIEDTANSNLIQGNLIGTNAAGTAGLGNQLNGVSAATSGNTIGGTAAGARNVISGNGSAQAQQNSGITLEGASATNNLIQGNYIGLNAAGTAALGNFYSGINVLNGASDNTIGGTTAGARNVISGNGKGAQSNAPDGIEILISDRTVVQGNYLGTDVTGTVAIGNMSAGIQVGGLDNIIGGTAPNAGNLISGNTNFGILVGGGGNPVSKNTLIQGNRIGTDVTGTLALANGVGVQLSSNSGPVSNNTVGGAAAGARNVISGNTTDGVLLSGTNAIGNFVQGNYIGTDVTGTLGLGNAQSGVFIQDAGDNTIGGLAAGSGNVIAFNGADGVTVVETVPDSTFGNAILSNSIFLNAELGIDLVGGDEAAIGFGVTPNDADDSDDGPNGLQNFPIIFSALPGSTIVSGQIVSTPGQTLLLQFFGNEVPDPSIYGEGQVFIGSLLVTTDGLTGVANFNVVFPAVFAQGSFITATATDGFGSTSEFSVFHPLPPDPSSGSVPDQGRDPLELAQLGSAAEPGITSPTSADPDFVVNLLFDGDAPRRFLQSLAEAEEQGGGSGESSRDLLGAVFNGEIGGGLFDDFNGNGKLDPNELPLVGQVVYLDANDNGKLDDDEWWTITNKRGEYRFQNLPPGRYIVRPVTAYETTVALLNKGYQVKRMPPMLTTAPEAGKRQAELTTQQRSVIDLNFSSRVRPDVRPFTPINPGPEKAAPTPPQGRRQPQPNPDRPPVAAQPTEAAVETAAATNQSSPRE